jgi:hypothetical protein
MRVAQHLDLNILQVFVVMTSSLERSERVVYIESVHLSHLAGVVMVSYPTEKSVMQVLTTDNLASVIVLVRVQFL